MSCFFNPLGCAESGFWSLIGMVPLWGWIVAGIVLVGVVWKFAGWPGLIGLAGAIGYLYGRRSTKLEPHEHVDGDEDPPVKRPRVKPGKRTRTIFDQWIGR